MTFDNYDRKVSEETVVLPVWESIPGWFSIINWVDKVWKDDILSVSPSSEQLGWQTNCQLLNSSQWRIYIINSADDMKLLWYNYVMLPLIPLITLEHLLVPLFVTVIVFHNWYIVTVVLLLPFSDFLTLSLIQGLFSWTQETLYKVGGLAALFLLSFLKLAFILSICINPLIAMSDQDIISPYNINTISTR